MTSEKVAESRAAIAAVEKLVHEMSNSLDYSEQWVEKASYLLDDLWSWLDKREEGDG